MQSSTGVSGKFLRVLAVGAAFALASFAVSGRARGAEPFSVWYRSSEGCPDAKAFLAQLAARSASARLAQVGDRIDFVVTLGMGDDGASGRLERQTDRGTVAIRELHGTRCESVAEGLALTLALTADADTSGNRSPQTAAPPPQPVAPARPARPLSARSDWGSEGAWPESESTTSMRSARPWRLGIYSSGATLTEGRLLLSGGGFLEWQRSARSAFARRSLRLTIHAGAIPEAARNLRVWIMASRIDASPFALGSATLQLRPALALDTGVITAENRVAAGEDRAFWLALSALARLSWQIHDRFSVEGEAGLLVPITRYALRGRADQTQLAQVDALGVSAGVAAAFELP